MKTSRWVAVVFLLVSVWYGTTALSFSGSYLGDSLGPGIFPFVLALVLGGCCLILFVQAPEHTERLDHSFLFNATKVVLSLVGYALCLEWLGFVVTTVLIMAALALIFKGPWTWSLVGGILFSLAMYALFVFALGLKLPLGVWVG